MCRLSTIDMECDRTVTQDRGSVLEVSSHAVQELREATYTAWEDGCLKVSEASLEPLWAGMPGILEARLRIVRPGDPVRLVNVLDAVEPALKTAEPQTTFPGALGTLKPAGVGPTRRLSGVAVLATADLRASHEVTALDVVPDGDSLVDMAGPGAAFSHWSATRNVVLSFRCDPAVRLSDVDRSMRRVTLALARALAQEVPGETPPDDVELLSWGEVSGELPRVCVILQVAAEGPLADTYFYGASLKGAVATMLDPREVLDGALTAGQYDWAGVRNPTHFYQRSDLLLRLLRAHGPPVDLLRSGADARLLALGLREGAHGHDGGQAGDCSWAPRGRSSRLSRPATRTPTRC